MIDELQKAYEKCVETCGEKLPCFLPEYLQARYEYHKLLVKYGYLNSKLIEKKLCQTF